MKNNGQVFACVRKKIFVFVGDSIMNQFVNSLWSLTRVRAAFVRANLLFKVADLMRERRHLFSAMMTLEVGKTWPEADGDTCEAIDFLDFYG